MSSEDVKCFVVKRNSLGHHKGLTVVFIKYQMGSVLVYDLVDIVNHFVNGKLNSVKETLVNLVN